MERANSVLAFDNSGPLMCGRSKRWPTNWVKQRWTARRPALRRVVGKTEHTQGDANQRFVVTPLSHERDDPRALYEDLYCAHAETESRTKECQLDLLAA